MKLSKSKSLYGIGYTGLPKVKTVGQLKKLLEQLPDKLPICGTQYPVWFNIGRTDNGINGEHLQFTEDGF